MSKVKKFFAIVLSMVMILGMSLTTFAAEVNVGTDGNIGTADDTGTIEVTGIKAEEKKNITVTAYKIIEAEYNAVSSTSNPATFSGYKNLYSPGINDMENPTVGELYAIKQQIDRGTIVEEGVSLGTGVEDGENLKFSKSGFEVGSYLIVVSGSEATTYSLAIASIRYVDSEGNWALEAKDLNMLASDNVWVKSTTGPTVDKKVQNGDSDTADKSGTGDIGDILTYTVTINPVPDYDGNYPVLQVEDTLSTGLVFTSTEENVSVRATNTSEISTVLVKGTDYTIDIDGNKLSVNFVVNDKYTLDNYVGGNVVITYNVKITDSVQQNQNSNTNDVTLTYSKDSNIQGNTGKDEDKTYTYTFDIDGAVDGSLTEGIITKVGETVTGQSSQPLEGAVFQLYTSYDASTGVSNQYNRVADTENGVTAWDGKVTSDEDGALKMQGLEGNKTYYLKEIQAPTGYSLSDKIYSIAINMNCDTDGQLIDYTITIKDVTASGDGNVNRIYYDNESEKWDISKNRTDIPNTTIAELPSTGGIGTTIFTIGGCAIMIAAAGLYFASRRRQENK